MVLGFSFEILKNPLKGGRSLIFQVTWYLLKSLMNLSEVIVIIIFFSKDSLLFTLENVISFMFFFFSSSSSLFVLSILFLFSVCFPFVMFFFFSVNPIFSTHPPHLSLTGATWLHSIFLTRPYPPR